MKKIMKRIVAMGITISLVASLTACSGGTSENTGGNSTEPADTVSDSPYDKIELKMNVGAIDAGSETAAYFAQIVEEASDGNVKIEVYPNYELSGGSMSQAMELFVEGNSFDMTVFSGSALSNIDQRFLTHSIPFAISSYEEANEYLDGTGSAMYAEMLKDYNIVLLAGLHNGLRHITNSKKEIKTPDDLKNMKIRVPNGEVAMYTLKQLGADPIAMNWSETFTALQQKTVDGQENGWNTCDSALIYEVNNYITECGWMYDGYWILANNTCWSKLNEATRELLKEKAQEAALYGRSIIEDGDAEIKDKWINEYGITVTELTEEEKQVFIDAVKGSQEYFIDKFGEDVCNAWGISGN